MHCTGKLYLPRVKLNAAIVPFTEELIGQFRMIMVVSVLVHVGPGKKCAVSKKSIFVKSSRFSRRVSP